MTDCPTEEITLTLPASTVDRLRRFTDDQHIDNVASRCINDGIDLAMKLHSSQWAKMGKPPFHRMSGVARLVRGDTN